MSFYDRLKTWQLERNTRLWIGIDPDDGEKTWPEGVERSPGGYLDFAYRIVEATAEYASAFKPNLGFWSAIGAENELAKLIGHIRGNFHLPVILDAKYNDIGNTAVRYARAAFERYDADAVTVNAYLGTDTLEPFLAWGPDRGILVLAHTSNKGAPEFQERTLTETGRKLFVEVAARATAKGDVNSAHIGLVMGATFPDQINDLNGHVPGNCLMLFPGIGRQEGAMDKTVVNARQHLFLIGSASSIIHASQGRNFAEAAAEKARALRDQINLALAAA